MTMDDSADTQIVEASAHTHHRELKGSPDPAFNFTMHISVDGKKEIDTHDTELRAEFAQNLKYWNDQTRFLSVNNIKNAYFRGIVDMGIDAVPLILESIKKRPSWIVLALDEILPGVMQYGEGYVPVKNACDAWISILSKIETN